MKRWTEDERQYVIDTYTTKSAVEQAQVLGRTYTSVVKQRRKLIAAGRVDRAKRAKTRPWSANDRETIISLLQSGYSVAEVAKRFGRSFQETARAIRQMGGAAHLRKCSEVANVWTLTEVARLLGRRDMHVVRIWIDRGWLKARRTTQRRSQRWYVTDAALQAFLAIREAWLSYDAARITDPLWREIAQELRAQAGGHWIKLADYATAHHYARRTPGAWVRSGFLTGMRLVSWQKHWYVWSADIEGWIPPKERDQRWVPPALAPAPRFGCAVFENGMRCSGNSYARGLCRKHHQRYMRHGDPLFMNGERKAS